MYVIIGVDSQKVQRDWSGTVASLGLVSSEAATDGVPIFSLKTDDLFSHRPLQSYR